MVKKGDELVKNILEAHGYHFSKIDQENIFAFKDKIGIVVSIKYWEGPTKIIKNRIYQRDKTGKWRYLQRGQISHYSQDIKKNDAKINMHRFIVCVFIFSNLLNKRVQPIYFRKFGTIFCIDKSYFSVWLDSLERTYLGRI